MKFISFKTFLLLIGLIGLYLLIRLFHFNSLPIFTDESIYIRWGQIALHDASWRFIALTDGKGPFFTWVTMGFLSFIKDPLVAGRTVSIISGLFTLIGLWLLTFSLFKNKFISLATCIFYIVFPFAQVYDRMALYDSMVGMFGVWSLYLSVLLVRNLRLDSAYTLGFVIGAGVITKSNAFFSLILLPFTLLLFDFGLKDKKSRFIRFVLLAGVVGFITEVIYNMLRLSPFFGVIKQKNALFVYPIREWLHHPFTYVLGNLHTLIPWLFTYLTIPFIILIIFSFFSRAFIRERIVLFLYFLIPLIVLALFGKVIYPRFLYPMALMLLPLAGYGLITFTELLQKSIFKKPYSFPLVYLMIIVFSVYPLFISLQFAIDPVKAKIASGDYNQYVYGWPAGWGVKESIDYLTTISQDQKIFVGTEGTFGLLPQSLEIYLNQNPNIATRGYWPIQNTIPSDLLNQAKKMPTYVIFYQPCAPCSAVGVAPAGWQLKKLFAIHKEKTESNYTVYQVTVK